MDSVRIELASCAPCTSPTHLCEGVDWRPGSFRKDRFYSYDHYREVNLPSPVNGGRFHLVTVSNASGAPGEITLNGKLVTFQSGEESDDWYVDWLHVYPTSPRERPACLGVIPHQVMITHTPALYRRI